MNNLFEFTDFEFLTVFRIHIYSWKVIKIQLKISWVFLHIYCKVKSEISWEYVNRKTYTATNRPLSIYHLLDCGLNSRFFLMLSKSDCETCGRPKKGFWNNSSNTTLDNSTHWTSEYFVKSVQIQNCITFGWIDAFYLI